MAWRSLAYGSGSTGSSVSKKNEPIPQTEVSSYVPTAIGGKIYKILEYLRNIPSHASVSGSTISSATGIELSPSLESVLQNNPKIAYKNDSYAYISKYQNVNDVQSFLRVLDKVYNSSASGIPYEDICDAYVGIKEDLDTLVITGAIICIRNTERGSDTYYSRHTKFYSSLPSKNLSGIEGGCSMVFSNPNPCDDYTKLVRRGDVLNLETLNKKIVHARVSNALRNSSDAGYGDVSFLMNQYKNSLSATSVKDLNTAKKIRYADKFSSTRVPIDIITSNSYNIRNISSVTKHGCTNDIRSLWSEVSVRNWPGDRHAFTRAMVKAGLDKDTGGTSSAANTLKRKRNGGSNKKGPRKRKQRAIKISNAHLIGTELGDILTGGGNANNTEFTLGATSYTKP